MFEKRITALFDFNLLDQFFLEETNIALSGNILQINLVLKIFINVGDKFLDELIVAQCNKFEIALSRFFPYSVEWISNNNGEKVEISFKIADELFSELNNVIHKIQSSKDIAKLRLSGEISLELSNVFFNLPE